MESILDPLYWKERLEQAAQQHHAIMKCPLEQWQKIESKHREILARHVGKFTDVLDAACGWGRAVDMMPSVWTDGYYLGLDHCPEFIAEGKRKYGRDWSVDDGFVPSREFRVADLLQPIETDQMWDIGLCISVRPMVVRNCGQETWDVMERNLRAVARKLLFLEYDPLDEGELS